MSDSSASPREIDPAHRVIPRVMGILNVTPDSFSDGGVHFERAAAIEAALRMERDGAAVIDIGGESTRPGAASVSSDEELNRVIPVIEGIRARSGMTISIDTRRSAVAIAAIGAGASIVNDVSGFAYDPAMAAAVASAGVPAIVMHMRGTPETMQSMTDYGDVVDDVKRELSERVSHGRTAGVKEIYIDPGIGFAKTFEQNLELLARCDELRELGPVVIGASRKRFIGHITGRTERERLAGSLAAVAAAANGGAAIVRVHDVRDTVDFLNVWAAIGRWSSVAGSRSSVHGSRSSVEGLGIIRKPRTSDSDTTSPANLASANASTADGTERRNLTRVEGSTTDNQQPTTDNRGPTTEDRS